MMTTMTTTGVPWTPGPPCHWQIHDWNSQRSGHWHVAPGSSWARQRLRKPELRHVSGSLNRCKFLHVPVPLRFVCWKGDRHWQCVSLILFDLCVALDVQTVQTPK